MAFVEQAVEPGLPVFRLREHPQVCWPPGGGVNPPWVGPGPYFSDPSRVTLVKIELVVADNYAGRYLTLIGVYGGNLYRTTLTMEDPLLLPNLCRALGKCAGKTIAEIGACKVDCSLNLA